MNENPERNWTLAQRETQRADRELQARRTELFAPVMEDGRCAYCGVWDGMESWAEDDIEAHDEPLPQSGWFKRANIAGYIYRPCDECNPEGDVPDAYSPLSWQAVLDWANRQRQEARKAWRRAWELDAVMGPYT